MADSDDSKTALLAIVLGELPGLYEADLSPLSRRQRIARALRRVTGAAGCAIRPRGTTVRRRKGLRAVHLPLGPESPLEARLYFREREPTSARLQAAEVVAVHAGRALASAPERRDLPGVSGPVEPLGRLGEEWDEAVVLRQSLTEVPTWCRTLTEGQCRVALLAAVGLTNREVADRLGVTERTVANHMAAVLGALELTSREELALMLASRRAS